MPINYKEYPENWKEIRERILKRANNKCEFCGVPNYSWVRKYRGQWHWALGDDENAVKIVLTIAHLDHDHKNHEVKDERLAALCQACHLSYDRPRHIYKRKYGMEVFNQPTLF